MGRIKTSVILFCALSSFLAKGQVGIIQDDDGYTNVRQMPNGQSKVIHRIYENEVFWFDSREEIRQADWVQVYIPKNDFSFDCSDTHLIGFIHKSRLKPLDQLSIYKGSDFTFKYVLQPFDSTNRIIDRDGVTVTAIDGRHVWGQDGGMPKTQISGISATVEGQPIQINKAFYSDLYECSNSFTIFRSGETFFVHQWNSDGAGYYGIIWVLTKEGLQQRVVGSFM
ncbi:hypothetical protein [Catalinimonas alkaloidigena]|nr:hypothetical protein [Catalinimonas alkaloidigena]